MSAMPKYALRYVPLFILALFLIPLRIYMAGSVQQTPAFPASQTASPFSPGSALYSVIMLPSGDVWAVGGSFFSKPAAPNTSREFLPSNGVILHYSDNAWIQTRVVGPLRVPLLSVSLSREGRDGWAVGWAGALVHYDGNEWSTVPGPANFNQNLLGVAMLSPLDGWAVGYSGSILHYDGKAWTQVPSPTQLDLRSIAMPSSQEGWAVGDRGTILHYHSGTWSIVSRSPTSNTLFSVSMLSTDEGWAVGRQGTILHFRDGTWESVHPASYYRNPSVYQSIDLFGVAMNSIRSGWVIGDQHLLTYSSEAWIEPDNRINFPINEKPPELIVNDLSLYGIAMSPSGEGWAVGRLNRRNSDAAIVILHYQGGKWIASFIAN